MIHDQQTQNLYSYPSSHLWILKLFFREFSACSAISPRRSSSARVAGFSAPLGAQAYPLKRCPVAFSNLYDIDS